MKILIPALLAVVILAFSSRTIEVVANSQEVSTIRIVTAFVTAYSPIEGCDDPDCIMASGKKVYEGAVACSRKIPLGTKVKIGADVYVCEDRLALRFDDRIDIFINDYQKAKEWGIQQRNVLFQNK